MAVDVKDVVGRVNEVLAPLETPEDAEQMEAYMKGHFDFLGIKTPARRTAVKPIMLEGKFWTNEELLDVAEALMGQKYREFHYVASELLRRWARNLESSDLRRIRSVVETNSWWDTVDAMAVHVVGPVVKGDRSLQDEMDRWVDDDNFWVARTAILHQLMWKEDTDAERLFHYCDRRAADTEFFIRKALGWALRQYARTDPEAVRAYVNANADQLSGLTKREALKHLG